MFHLSLLSMSNIIELAVYALSTTVTHVRLISNFCLFPKIFIQGLVNLNRAVNEDVVCVEVLPEKDWTCPSSIVIDEGIKEDEAEENTAKQVCWNSFELLQS